MFQGERASTRGAAQGKHHVEGQRVPTYHSSFLQRGRERAVLTNGSSSVRVCVCACMIACVLVMCVFPCLYVSQRMEGGGGGGVEV